MSQPTPWGVVAQAGQRKTHVARLDRNTWTPMRTTDPAVAITYTHVRTLCGITLGRFRRVVQMPADSAVVCPDCPRHV